ncbi:YraN family protein [Candidatus Berkelbacteria bacterium CG08_land_8_20_14_0_20_39_8]|uniref:UPF0102 protein COT12_00170 n=1 Tax=Candidatus Berkelbacteria bacterium CG08_land_8_20_14_0_20_39_8 TaxID=1974511 RepID=A0A2M6YD36_9BACT|nr:MAG: YraN family protein [Candidatus Berkelbacteria bacterium CG08_land_8_20_14_0_20_39_8]
MVFFFVCYNWCMNRKENKKNGNWGEDLAAKYLLENKYGIIDRNINYPFGEIDILSRDRKTIVIVEVKTVWGSGFGKAVDLVRRKKADKLRLLAKATEKDYPNENIRIDVIGIDSGIITHIKNAVEGK